MCLYSRKRDGITWETFFIKEAFTKGYKGSPQGADGKRVGSGAGGIRRARRVKQAVRACLPGGRGNQNSSGARFAQGMRESVLVTDRNRLYHGGQLLLPKRDEPMEGRPEATTPPKSDHALLSAFLLSYSLTALIVRFRAHTKSACLCEQYGALSRLSGISLFDAFVCN